MMTAWRRVLCIAAIALTGCGNLQSLKVASVPQSLRGQAIEPSPRPAAKDGVAPRAQALGEGGLYLMQSGGGSAALGLLLGGLGAAINSANVAAENEKILKSAAPSSLLQLQPVEELSAAWRDAAAAPASASGSVKASPYVILYVDNERKFIYPVAGLRVDGPLAGATAQPAWTGHYLFAIDKPLPAEVLSKPLAEEQFTEFKAKVRAAYVQLRSELATDVSGSPPGAPARHIASVNSTYLRAIQIGFAGFTSGDVDISPSGSMSLRVSIDNYGPAMDRSVPYFVWYFPSASQYTFGLGPEPRKALNQPVQGK